MISIKDIKVKKYLDGLAFVAFKDNKRTEIAFYSSVTNHIWYTGDPIGDYVKFDGATIPFEISKFIINEIDKFIEESNHEKE